MRNREACAGLAGLLAGTALLACTAAWAGAFNEPAGQGEAIFGGLLDRGSQSFSTDGHILAVSPYSKREAAAYVEYGITDWLEAIIKPELVSTSLGGSPGGHYTGLGTSDAGAQVRLLVFGPAVLAVQGTFQLPATTRQSNLALVGNTSRNTDGRLLAGYGFALGSWASFVDAEAGYRIRGSGAPDETHMDLTLGTRPRPDVLLLLQSFTTLPVGRGTTFFPASASSNLEASVVYDLSARWSVQAGAFETIDGRDALREHGLTVAVWYRF